MTSKNKSFCWVDGETCIYHSHLTCLKDAPIESCSRCSRYEQNKELLINLMKEFSDSLFVSDEDMGTICFLLNNLNRNKRILSKTEKMSLRVILNKYA